MALIKTRSRGIADNAVGVSALDLTANYTFTGTHKTNNGMDLLLTRSDSSAVNYNNDTEIFDFTSYLSTYKTFMYTLEIMPTSPGGNYHLWQSYKSTAGGSRITGRTITNGRTDNNSNNTPDTGTGDYHRIFYLAAGPGIAGYITGYIVNGQRNDADYDAAAYGITNYHYSGVGQATNTFSFAASGGAASGIGVLGLNLDQVSHSNDMTAYVKAHLWGVK